MEGSGLVSEVISELAYPLIEFSQGHLVIVNDETRLQRCTRTGVRRGWYDCLEIVDASLRRWPVRLIGTRTDGLVGWFTGRLIADLQLGPPESVSIEDVKRRTVDVLKAATELWDADGQLDERLQAVRRASDMEGLVDSLEAHVP
jgi:hypothetical protein